MNIKSFVYKYILLFSFVLTMLMVVIVDFFKIPNPNVILLTAIVYLTFLGGFYSGAISGIIVILYSIYFFSMPNHLCSFSSENLKKVMVIILFIPIMILIVGTLKRQYILKTKELELAICELSRVSRLDPLTGISNRRYFDELYQKAYNLAVQEQSPISSLMIDIDFFKKYNDYYGHVLGDDCLKKFAMTISNEFQRPNDIIARFGGEEFIVVLPHTESKEAISLGNKLINSLAVLNISHCMSPICSFVTVSVGVATFTEFDGHNHLELIERADKALYIAKANGRNQVAFINEA